MEIQRQMLAETQGACRAYFGREKTKAHPACIAQISGSELTSRLENVAFFQTFGLDFFGLERRKEREREKHSWANGFFILFAHSCEQGRARSRGCWGFFG